MARYRLTSKGQVTIPKAMRDAIGLRAGDVVGFELDEPQARIVIARTEWQELDDHPLVQRFRSAGRRMTMSADEWRSLMRDPEDEDLL